MTIYDHNDNLRSSTHYVVQPVTFSHCNTSQASAASAVDHRISLRKLEPDEMIVKQSDFASIVAERNRLRDSDAELRATVDRLEAKAREAATAHEIALSVQRKRISEMKVRDASANRFGPSVESFNAFCANVHKLAVEKGWYDDKREVPELVALIHSEASEVLEAYRLTKPGDDLTETTFAENGKPEGIPSELADIVIRVCDMAAYLGINLGMAIASKHMFNATRPRRHGNKRA
jgi:NTP pyrophosphatase (non-canonical NTP hydrolase)